MRMLCNGRNVEKLSRVPGMHLNVWNWEILCSTPANTHGPTLQGAVVFNCSLCSLVLHVTWMCLECNDFCLAEKPSK